MQGTEGEDECRELFVREVSDKEYTRNWRNDGSILNEPP